MINFLMSEDKNTDYLTPAQTMIIQMLKSLWRLYRVRHRTGRNTKSTKPEKTGFPKESVESADLHKLVSNKNEC